MSRSIVKLVIVAERGSAASLNPSLRPSASIPRFSDIVVPTRVSTNWNSGSRDSARDHDEVAIGLDRQKRTVGLEASQSLNQGVIRNALAVASGESPIENGRITGRFFRERALLSIQLASDGGVDGTRTRDPRRDRPKR